MVKTVYWHPCSSSRK